MSENLLGWLLGLVHVGNVGSYRDLYCYRPCGLQGIQSASVTRQEMAVMLADTGPQPPPLRPKGDFKGPPAKSKLLAVTGFNRLILP
jgi:hypothetical protein